VKPNESADPSPAYIRSVNPYAPRTGEWAKVRGITVASFGHHPCYRVEFPDGATWEWLVYEGVGPYEFCSEEEILPRYESRERAERLLEAERRLGYLDRQVKLSQQGAGSLE